MNNRIEEERFARYLKAALDEMKDTPLSCPDEDKLFAYNRGELTNDEAEIIHEHLLHCDSCVDLLRDVIYFEKAYKASAHTHPTAEAKQAWKAFQEKFGLERVDETAVRDTHESRWRAVIDPFVKLQERIKNYVQGTPQLVYGALGILVVLICFIVIVKPYHWFQVGTRSDDQTRTIVLEEPIGKIVTQTPSFRWQATVPVDSFVVVVSISENGVQSVLWRQATVETKLRYPDKFLVLEKNKTYTWRVEAFKYGRVLRPEGKTFWIQP